ncbi:putative bifunctional inhibitor/plant lipid transfer protein/seed storage helical [Helianthus debilis subsp. tardiflorus]
MRSAAYAVALLMMILAGSMVTTTAVTCSVTELSPCLPSFTSASPPSAQCCAKLKEQKPCLCGYIKNPSLKQYVSSPNAKKVASTCGVPIPNC